MKQFILFLTLILAFLFTTDIVSASKPDNFKQTQTVIDCNTGQIVVNFTDYSPADVSLVSVLLMKNLNKQDGLCSDIGSTYTFNILNLAYHSELTPCRVFKKEIKQNRRDRRLERKLLIK